MGVHGFDAQSVHPEDNIVQRNPFISTGTLHL